MTSNFFGSDRSPRRGDVVPVSVCACVILFKIAVKMSSSSIPKSQGVRQAGKQVGRQASKQAGRQAGRPANRQVGRQASRLASRQAGKQAGKH